MANWRTEIKKYFADACLSAIPFIKHFGAWNTQTNNPDTEETRPEIGIFFEYSSIGDGLEYLLQLNMQQSERIPVEVTLHLMFNNYNDQFQDLAYEYAEAITCELVGKKHELIHGRILKVGEVEDGNHRAVYDYQVSFAFFIKEVVFKPDANQDIDSNPVDPEGNPVTGRTLYTDIRGIIE